MSKFADRLRDLKEEKGVTLEIMEKEIGLTMATLSRYQTSKRTPAINLVEKIADYFNVSVDYLLGNTDKRQPNNMYKNNENIFLKPEDISRRNLITKIIKLAKELDIVEIEALDTILDGGFSLVDLLETLELVQQVAQQKKKKKG